MSRSKRSRSRVLIGDLAPLLTMNPTEGRPLDLGAPGVLTHLQFRRFAGCPICNMHLRSIIQRHDEITAAGIREIVVFHSTAEELGTYQAGMPFPLVADPGKDLYRAFGVEASARSVLNPRVWPSIPRALGGAMARTLRRGSKVPPINPHGGQLGLPADFLIDPIGRVLAAKYGGHAFDQWSVDELLAHARDSRRSLTPPT